MAVVATAADNNYTSRQHYFAMTATSASDSTPLQVLMPSTSTLAPVLRMDKDALLLIIQRLESFDDLARLAASCHFFHNLLFATDDCCTRKYTTAKEKSEIFQGVARRRWPEADVDLFYGGNWQRMCSDDNAADSASCTIVEVPVTCLEWPEHQRGDYEPHSSLVKLAGREFKLTAGILNNIVGASVVETLGIALELLDAVEEGPFCMHVLVTILHDQIADSFIQEGNSNPYMFSACCDLSDQQRDIVFRNCASCSVLLNPSSGYLHVNQKRTGPLQSMDPEGQADDQGPMLRIRLRLDALKFHDKKCSMQRRQRTSRRHTTTIRCNRAKTAMMEVPGQSTGLDTLVRRCWSVIPQVRALSWRYMWHLISGFQQKNDAEAMKCLLCSLADAGAIRLLLHFSAADDHKIALVALHVICLAAEVEELASRLNKLDAIKTLKTLNATTSEREIRLCSGQAVSSLIPLDSEGLEIILGLKIF